MIGTILTLLNIALPFFVKVLNENMEKVKERQKRREEAASDALKAIDARDASALSAAFDRLR